MIKPALSRAAVVLLLALLTLPALAQDASLDELIARARKRDAEAEYALGMRAYEGRGLPRNPRQAYQLLERAAGRGHLEAQNALGYFLQHGVGVPANLPRAREWYETAAARGHARAQVNLGWLHQEGLGVPRNLPLALEWYRKAAALGFAEGEHNGAYLLELGVEGIAADSAAAAAGYARAAAKGFAPAAWRLGRMIEDGRAPARAYGSALERYAAAARGGVAEAQALLDDADTLYRLAVLTEPAAALPWLRMAAAKDHVLSELALGIALEEGRGTARNPVEAAQWYGKAAAAENAEAHFRLGNLYDRGSGLRADTTKARDHYARAAALGHPAARARMAQLLGDNSTPPPVPDPFKGLR